MGIVDNFAIRNYVIETVNKAINIPIIGEQVEAKLIARIYDIIAPMIESFLLAKLGRDDNAGDENGN